MTIVTAITVLESHRVRLRKSSFVRSSTACKVAKACVKLRMLKKKVRFHMGCTMTMFIPPIHGYALYLSTKPIDTSNRSASGVFASLEHYGASTPGSSSFVRIVLQRQSRRARVCRWLLMLEGSVRGVCARSHSPVAVEQICPPSYHLSEWQHRRL